MFAKENAAMRTAVIVAALFALAACETIQGAGRDMQNAGRAIQTEAAQAQSNL